MRSNLLILAALLTLSISTRAQQPPKEFFDGMNKLQTNLADAKKDMLTAVAKMPQFHGSYHFLGVIYLREHKPDSAIACFTKSILLNTDNVNHTTEMTYSRLISTYMQQQDFENAFKTGTAGLKLYADSKMIANSLRDACLWAYYTQDNELDPGYLSPDIKPEYAVKSISEEYLILRNLRIDDNALQFSSQSLVNKKNAAYDVLKCSPYHSDQVVELNFKIGWDMNKYFGGMQGPADKVAADNTKPVYERVGATLVADDKADLKTTIEKFSH